jgi:cytochrome c biogenesis protein CcmG, thiol:disulfide interchange protein DsbE
MPMTSPGSRDRVRAEERRRRVMFAAIGVGVVAIAVVIGVLSASETGSALSVADVAGDPEVDGEALSTAPEDPGADPEAGSASPVARGADFDGASVTIGEPGQAQMVMFMASWCPACQEELPEVVDWIDAGGPPEGVDVVSVATLHDDTRPNWPPQEWFEREGFDGPVLVDDAGSSVAEAFGLRATPYWVAIDADGQVAARVTGMLGAEQLDALAAQVQDGA